MEHYVIKPAGEAGEAAVHAGLRAYNRTFVSDTADLSLVVEDEAGQIIGLGGSSGRSTGPHLHFELWYKGHPVNPEKYIVF